jgi:hypothetical protein
MKQMLIRGVCVLTATMGIGAAVESPASASEVSCFDNPSAVQIHTTSGLTRCFAGLGSNPTNIPGVDLVRSGSHSGFIVFSGGTASFSPNSTAFIYPPRTVTNVSLSS